MFQVNFLPWRENKLKKSGYFWSGFFLLQILIIITVTLFIHFFLQNEYQKREITLHLLLKKHEKLQNTYNKTKQRLIDLKDIQSSIQIYENIYQKTKSYLTLLNQLSNFIPERCWLLEIKQKNQTFILDGISHDYNSIALFIEGLSQKILIHNIELQKVSQKKKGVFYFTIAINEFLSL
ncbi:fimbrial assembly protein [Candidatus Williamhamiltonella defendens]|nr:PilN domain-containing protein [Candidatus Hamiltonella defensa]AYB49761.1 fimbrial assembly protein [Candidatus Hamiltonella defensa]